MVSAMDREQHFLRLEVARNLLLGLSIAGKDIVEFGAGRGALTRLLLDAGDAEVEAWEIDPELAKPFPDSRLTWVTADILDASPHSLRGRAVAAFPPYALLPFILDLCSGLPHILLMVPPKRMAQVEGMGFRLLETFDGDAFEPTSKGNHLVVARGFQS
jgi:16S rRNA A1518/A1519 N6-dimethyltransferase RsmA/KsgA/DIM1 with predicted DNA glycosylase/AP lyase activity